MNMLHIFKYIPESVSYATHNSIGRFEIRNQFLSLAEHLLKHYATRNFDSAAYNPRRRA